MDRLAIIVASPECCGSRLVTRLLIAAGCHGEATAPGKAQYRGWPQKYDAFDPEGETPIVIRRTFPYHPYRTMPDMDGLYDRLVSCAYNVKAVVLSREPNIVATSQLRKAYAARKESALKQIAVAHKLISMFVDTYEVDTYKLEYEKLVKEPIEEVNKMLEAIGLKPLDELPEDIYDGNEKYEVKK